MRRQPKVGKYRKQFKGGSGKRRARGVVRDERTRGEYGLIAVEVGRVSARQMEASRRARRSGRNRRGKVWIKMYPRVPVTKKPVEVRMGKGKGNVEYWVAHVQPGIRRYERGGVKEKRARRALSKAGSKRGVGTKRVYRTVGVVKQ
jgi:large subunit ribosomal protein L16